MGYLHFKIQPQSRIEQAIPPEFNAFVYTLKGKLKIGDKGTEIDAHHTATLTRDASANGVVLANEGEEVAEFVLIGGEPHNEPIEQYGPFVMNTREEIMKAFTHYQSGRNGFERAPTFHQDWSSHVLKTLWERASFGHFLKGVYVWVQGWGCLVSSLDVLIVMQAL